MIYALLRSIAQIALRWYYADVTIVRDAREEMAGPLLVVVNHPNALIDVLVAGSAIPRRLMFTAKATLFRNPIASLLLRWIGVVPLRRASDEAAPGAVADPTRNAAVFESIIDALGRGRAVLIFPEGKSHDDPAIAPLRSGTARMALAAAQSGRVPGLRILPVGLIFERKDAPRSRILTIVGEPLSMDQWVASHPDASAPALTAEIDERLRTVTLNYATAGDAERDARLARQVAGLVRSASPSIGEAGSLRQRIEIARLLPDIREHVRTGSDELRDRAARFESDVASFRQSLLDHRIALDDLSISPDLGPGLRFVIREGLVMIVAGPIALWGWINHLLPFRAAFIVGRRVRDSAADPAMRTVLAGVALVLTAYMLQGALVSLLFGPWIGVTYVVSLPVAADVNLRLSDRLTRARRRARTYLLFRMKPDVRAALATRAIELRDEAIGLGRATGVVSAS